MALNSSLIAMAISLLTILVSVITAYNMIKFKVEALEAKVKNLEAQVTIAMNDQLVSFFTKVETKLEKTNEALIALKLEFASINGASKYKKE